MFSLVAVAALGMRVGHPHQSKFFQRRNIAFDQRILPLLFQIHDFLFGLYCVARAQNLANDYDKYTSETCFILFPLVKLDLYSTVSCSLNLRTYLRASMTPPPCPLRPQYGAERGGRCRPSLRHRVRGIDSWRLLHRPLHPPQYRQVGRCHHPMLFEINIAAIAHGPAML